MEEKNVTNSFDYFLAFCVVAHSAILYLALTCKISLVGYALPVVVAIFSTYITVNAVRSFNEIHKNK